MSRTSNSAKNMASNLGISLIMIFLGFITRKVFVDNVGLQYLGLNGLLQNILGVMTLLEGGFAASVVYNMYKPLAEDDRPKILALLQLYGRVYRWIAFGLIVFSLLLYPFIGVFVKDADGLDYISIVYFIFVFNSVIGYFSAYKWSIINASQQNYKLTFINLFYQVGLNLSKLAILYYTKNYILYLLVESAFGVCLNVAVIRKANKLFPYIKTKEKYEVEPDVRKNITTNMKALFIHKLGGYFMHSTDNIVISSFVGVATIGLYSNYTLLTGVIASTSNQILNSFSESVGNLIATESREKIYEVFKTSFFLNFLITSTGVIVMFNTLKPFISWWLGKDYLLYDCTVYIIMLNFYIDMLRNTAMMYKTKAGIFVADRFTPLLQGLINVVLSLLFVQWWGLTGVLAATSISILSIGFWQFPRLCYKHIFHKPLWMYFKMFFFYTCIGLSALLISSILCYYINLNNLFIQSIVNALVSITVILVSYFLAFRNLSPFQNLLLYVKSLTKL